MSINTDSVIFFTEMMAGIEAKFFEGGNFGKNLKYSITEFQNDNFRYVYTGVFHLMPFCPFMNGS